MPVLVVRPPSLQLRDTTVMLISFFTNVAWYNIKTISKVSVSTMSLSLDSESDASSSVFVIHMISSSYVPCALCSPGDALHYCLEGKPRLLTQTQYSKGSRFYY